MRQSAPVPYLSPPERTTRLIMWRVGENSYRAGGPRISRSEESSRPGAATASSRHSPTAINTGVASADSEAGLALCAATQIRQEAESVGFGWLWVDSAAIVHSIKDRHSQADHRTQKRMDSRFGLDCLELITVICAAATSGKLL